jgi:hypothetical protein
MDDEREAPKSTPGPDSAPDLVSQLDHPARARQDVGELHRTASSSRHQVG